MGFKTAINIILALILGGLIIFYFLPINKINFTAPQQDNSNFSVVGNASMQYYSNLRFSSPTISYRIANCPLQKQNEMESAFRILENFTSLRFYPAASNEKIYVTCDERDVQYEGNGMFVAGEGGPTDITKSGSFAVIMHGKILLIRDSKCPAPNIAIHELLHVLGFQHSANPQNIMYNVTSCDQTIGDDIIQLINNLYSVPSYPDLSFENASASMNGRMLNLDVTVLNSGLNDAGSSTLEVYADGKALKEMPLESIEIGYGRIIHMENIWVPQLSVNEIKLEIISDFSELSKENNNLTLDVKK